MRFQILALTSLLGLTLAAPSADKRDQFEPCSNFGSNCATQGQQFCDASTGKTSICHQFGSDCWIQYTQDACTAKREPAVETVEKRDQFAKCSVFGANCAVNGNEFCYDGIKSVCEQVPFSDDCWVRYTAQKC